MKSRLGLVISMAAVLSASAGLLDGKPVLEGLFGHKFGERVAATVPTIPSSEGTLLTSIEPSSPEFALQQYWMVLLPQSRTTCGFIGVSSFGLTEKEKCEAVYAMLMRGVEKRFGEMQKIPPADLRLGESTKTLRTEIIKLDNDRTIMLYMLKSPAEYSVRLFSYDMRMTRRVVDENRALAKKVVPLTGLFGKCLGDVIPVKADEERLANGVCVQTFEPEKRFLDFELYIMSCLPKSRKLYAITGVKDYEERFGALQCFERVSKLLEKKFGLKLSDCTANFSTDKPDEGGEQMLKAAAMAFPNSVRYVEIHCLHDADDNVFRVRLSALDAGLMGFVEKEAKSLKREAVDSEALDAL